MKKVFVLAEEQTQCFSHGDYGLVSVIRPECGFFTTRLSAHLAAKKSEWPKLIVIELDSAESIASNPKPSFLPDRFQ